MRPCDIMAAKPCPNLARTHALYTRFPLCFHCVLPCASLTFPVFRTQFRYEQASNSIDFAYAQLRETDAKPPLAPIAQLLHARRRSFARSNDLFTFFLSRVHSCTIRLISLFPMTKNARYGRINFRGRLAQRERRCLTSIGSGVQIPHRPPFERTMAAHLSSHFLFPIIQTAAYRTNNVSDFGRWRRPAPIFYGKSHPNRLSHSDKKCVPLLTFSQVA